MKQSVFSRVCACFVLLLVGLGPMCPGWALSSMDPNTNLSPATTPPASPSVVKGHVQMLEGKYTLSPGDKVNISVYSAPEYDRNDLTIRPDGMLTLQPFGEIEAAGLTVGELTDQIETKLQHYLKKPEVALTVSQFHSAVVYVLGAVQKPGPYEIHGDMEQPDSPSAVLVRGNLTVTNLIANAGGVLQNADISHVAIRHTRNNTEQQVDLLRLLKEGDTTQDAVLGSGDSLFIPTQSTTLDAQTLALMSHSALAPDTLTVRVIGKVASPGVYPLKAQNAGVNSAIASAKGYIIEANKHSVEILRTEADGKLHSTIVNPRTDDFILQDNDVVMVDERNVPLVGRGLDYTARVLMPFVSMGIFGNAVMDLIHPARRFPARQAPPTVDQL